MRTCTALAAFVLLLPVSPFALSADGDMAKLVLVAGGGDKGDGSPAVEAKLDAPFGVDFDKAGNMYIVEMQPGQRVLKVDSGGTLTTFAGTGKKGDGGD